MDEATAPYARLLDASLGAWRLSCQLAETMIAAQAAIGSRLALIGAGLADPHAVPGAKIERRMLGRPAPFARVGIGTVHGPGSSARDGPAWNRLPGALADDVMTSFALLDRTIAASLAWWRPIGTPAKAHARRPGRPARHAR